MPNTSGLFGGVAGIDELSSSSNISAQVTVSGAAISNFDGLLQVQRQINSEFDASVCVNIQVAQVSPTATITLPTVVNSSGLPNFNFNFSGTGVASGNKEIIDYRWFFNDFQSSVSGGQTTDHTFTESGSFLVVLRVMDTDGFFGFDSIRINTHSGVALDLPLLSTSGVPQDGSAPLLVDFTSTASGVAGTTILGYNWNFGNGQYSKRQNQNDVHYATPGNYIPVCTVEDSRNVKVSDSIDVGVNN